nr:alpha-amylase (AMY) [Polytomella parva]|eukprot:CAMPEP_0175064410 /NCGR_PEP_ID=MMETSP0052_2-20121109/15318_1 /TAXON_ID=51329 ORGANISM="Polytomella parva, Strain SAG 63-3" /NCGR_SAMPLE_ID=MMETSP0052_2 /ASSEMBLY_ACC=CAM_ASM_000194 /LENGTH=482 /DNA_ID=CAMNT_0016330759 /DNA_START=41 /DNA_END=1489 /DNA_ORIENTATION=-
MLSQKNITSKSRTTVPGAFSANIKPTPKGVVSKSITHFSKVSCGKLKRNNVKIAAVPEAGVVAAPTSTRAQDYYRDTILLQSFGWDSCTKPNFYGSVESKVPEIQESGYTHIWLPPPSQSVSPQGYMPGQLYNLKSNYGSKESLSSLLKSLKSHNIKSVADIVINHRCADDMVDGVYNKFRDDVDHQGRRIDWGQWAITSNDPNFKGTGNPDTGDDYGPAPDLDHANPELRAALKDWLKWLHEDIGFEGWRLDFVRGYGARFVKEYIDYTTTDKSFNVGEFWVDSRWNGSELEYNQDEGRQKLVNWLNGNGKTCCAFDFSTKGILQEAMKKTQYWRLKDAQGKAPGLLGWWPGMTVTFVDNHDTGSTQQHWPFPSSHVSAGYAYILTHPGIPCVFWDHAFTWGPDLNKAIKTLITLRKAAGIHADSKLEILCAEADMYVARIDNKITLKLGPRYDMGGYLPKADLGWKLATYGNDYAIWKRF